MIIETSLTKMQKHIEYGYGDWQYVFAYADGFSISDVDKVLASVEGENDGPEWVAVFELKDGRFAVLRAGCDYTGWGCQESGRSETSDTLDQLIFQKLTDDERVRLGINERTQK